MSEQSRKHEMEVEISAPVEQVWQALSTAEGIASWFAPIVRVEPGVGGSMFGSWGPGMEGTERIEIWEPNRQLRLTHDRSGRASPSVVDYILEGRGGSTILRLVHSGFDAGAQFDDEFEATGAAWPVFLKMLKHSVERGIGACRNATTFRMLDQPRKAVWARLARQLPPGILRHLDARGLCCLEFPDRQNAMLSIFCEQCGAATGVTITWLLYDATPEEAATVRDCWSALVDGLFAQSGAV